MRIPHSEPLFITTYYSEPETVGDVEKQLETRYFAARPSFEPTEQERKWGIETIDPASSYWYNFIAWLPRVVQTLADDPESNRAVITISHPQPPCFQSFQWKVRDRAVHLTCFARSLDLENGLPVDSAIFWRAALEPVARQLCLRTGSLTIVSPGAHTYTKE